MEVATYHKQIGVRVETELATAFEKKCQADGLRVSEVIKLLMTAYLDNKFEIKKTISIDVVKSE